MTEESETPPPPTVVRAKFGFDGRNNDELSFKKNDMITLTQEIEGGWWEGTINGKTGWFPCDYAIKEHQETRLRSKSPSGLRSNDVSVPSQSTKGVYRTIVLKDFVESEKAHVTELQALFRDYLQPLRAENVLDKQSCDTIVSNIELIIEQQLEILQSVEQFLSSPNAQQRVGGVLLSLAPNMKHLLRAYCENHPKAVEILNEKRELLEAFVQKHEGTMKAFITGLSKPFRHLQKYASTLQELERNIEEGHPDRGDTQRAASVYRDLAHFCSHIRKQKEMQIELLSTGLIRDWVGDAPITSFGDIKYMGTVSVQNNAGEPEDRCLVAFSTVMFVLEITPELNSYILKRRITMKGATVRKLETPQHTLQISEANEDKVLEITLPSSEEMNHWILVR
uniref:Rho guanine nucleotide exchange factor 7 n=1 Tax=Plectus sambesii TaxID=2011161 RepID=A0A914WN16_9BILA